MDHCRAIERCILEERERTMKENGNRSEIAQRREAEEISVAS